MWFENAFHYLFIYLRHYLKYLNIKPKIFKIYKAVYIFLILFEQKFKTNKGIKYTLRILSNKVHN